MDEPSDPLVRLRGVVADFDEAIDADTDDGMAEYGDVPEADIFTYPKTGEKLVEQAVKHCLNIDVWETAKVSATHRWNLHPADASHRRIVHFVRDPRSLILSALSDLPVSENSTREEAGVALQTAAQRTMHFVATIMMPRHEECLANPDMCLEVCLERFTKSDVDYSAMWSLIMRFVQPSLAHTKHKNISTCLADFSVTAATDESGNSTSLNYSDWHIENTTSTSVMAWASDELYGISENLVVKEISERFGCRRFDSVIGSMLREQGLDRDQLELDWRTQWELEELYA